MADADDDDDDANAVRHSCETKNDVYTCLHVYRRFCVPERIDANRKLLDSAYERHTD